MDEKYIGKRCRACGLDLADCERCSPAEVKAATRGNSGGWAPGVQALATLQDQLTDARAEVERLGARVREADHAVAVIARQYETLRGAVLEYLAADASEAGEVNGRRRNAAWGALLDICQPAPSGEKEAT